ncbi:hypothetical protein [Nitrosopumilus sp.]|uniref:capsular polysaccharide export protein, LipB/KpsS family n=1 Tax=Nitrosopumilus sp. TaxID=2024843 RepID=UPI00247B95BF|nr:hypothetical protein [Nitrosopumilus sp.]MCV0410547.1 hypothetical protein [Nitrosopumilus sp.]
MGDKIIFWLDQTLLPFFVANNFHKKNDYDLYAIIDITNRTKNFFQEQKFVPFKKVWYYHDYLSKNKKDIDMSYLSEFEKKYGVDLWNLAINERIFYRFNRIYKFSREEILNILSQECKLFESILDEIKPDFFITKVPPLHHHQLFYEICKAKGIKVLNLYLSRIGKKCIISQETQHLDSTESLKDIEGKNRDFTELQNYLKSFNYSGQIKNYVKKRSSSKLNKIKAAIQFFLISKNTNIGNHYFYSGRTKLRVFFDTVIFSLKKKYRRNFVNNNLKQNLELSEPFIYFALSNNEERNLLISAPFFTNQIENVRHVAKSIPIGYRLYVKEHPAQEIRGWRSISDYKQIMEIPNVTLIHPSYPTEKLYNNCSLVITIGGTAGLDAAFYGKPSIIFSDLGYAILPSVEKVSSIHDLSKTIRLSLKKNVNSSDLDKYLILLDKNSFDFDLLDFEMKEHDYFYYGSILADVEIPIKKMEDFIFQHQTQIDSLSSEFEKKIKQFKESN